MLPAISCALDGSSFDVPCPPTGSIAFWSLGYAGFSTDSRILDGIADSLQIRVLPAVWLSYPR